MHRFVMRPKVHIQPRAWGTLLRGSAPLAVVGILATLSFRTSVVLLGLVSAGSADVGDFGAAYRLIEAAMFVPAAFNAAALAWFSRETEIGRGFEMAIKTVLALMLPIGLGLALFAEPLIDLLYGSQYGGAVTPLRLLGGMAALWGINSTIVTVLVSRGRPDVYTFPALAALVPNAVLALVLIPAHGGGRRGDRRPHRRGRARDAGPAAHGAAGRRRPVPARPGRAARGRSGDGALRHRPLRAPVDPRRDRLRGGLRRRVPRHRTGVLAG
jgi:hypothetical protein